MATKKKPPKKFNSYYFNSDGSRNKRFDKLFINALAAIDSVPEDKLDEISKELDRILDEQEKLIVEADKLLADVKKKRKK